MKLVSGPSGLVGQVGAYLSRVEEASGSEVNWGTHVDGRKQCICETDKIYGKGERVVNCESKSYDMMRLHLQHLPTKNIATTITYGFHSNTLQVTSKPKPRSEELMEKILNRRWSLSSPETKIHQVIHGHGGSHGHNFLINSNPDFGDGMREIGKCFYIVRDDLLHPLVNGNKARKLDGLIPLIEEYCVTDVVTCGGCQSSHTAAIAVLCAERGVTSHLLLRGEQPEILTGYNLISTIYGNVTYVPRTIYANREGMLKGYVEAVAGNSGSVLWFSDIIQDSSTTELSASPNILQMDENTREGNLLRKFLIVNEGAGDSVALLGIIRLVHYLSQNHLLGRQRALRFVVDAGTGTTAVGLALAALWLGLPWEVYAVMLADKIEGYRRQEERLISEFKNHFDVIDNSVNGEDSGIVHWVERGHPRKFGNVLEGEVEACQQIAQQTGVLVDPVYTLAAWETAMLLSSKEDEGGSEVVMLHTGGTLGMFGLAQRYKNYFSMLKKGFNQYQK